MSSQNEKLLKMLLQMTNADIRVQFSIITYVVISGFAWKL